MVSLSDRTLQLFAQSPTCLFIANRFVSMTIRDDTGRLGIILALRLRLRVAVYFGFRLCFRATFPNQHALCTDNT